MNPGSSTCSGGFLSCKTEHMLPAWLTYFSSFSPSFPEYKPATWGTTLFLHTLIQGASPALQLCTDSHASFLNFTRLSRVNPYSVQLPTPLTLLLLWPFPFQTLPRLGSRVNASSVVLHPPPLLLCLCALPLPWDLHLPFCPHAWEVISSFNSPGGFPSPKLLMGLSNSP